MDIYLNFGSKIQLPVLPSSFNIKGEMINTEVNINSIGTVNLLGKRGLKGLEFSSFFPGQAYNFCRCTPMAPYDYCKKVETAMENNAIGVVTITGTNINLTCTIENFEYGEEDGSGDVAFTISFKEYRTVTASRVAKKTKKRTYKAKTGDNFYKISRILFGNSAYASKIAKANKKKVSYKFKKAKKIKIPAV